MKKLFLLIIIAAFASCKLITVRKSNDGLWEEFKNFFNKTYTEEDEFERRPKWEQALIEIMMHNVGFYNGTHSYSVGVNHFTDMLEDEFRQVALGLDLKLKCQNKSLIYDHPKYPIPPSVNWVDRGYVTEIRDQGNCGACWAFCGVAALEGQHKRMTGKLVKLSEQQLIDCSAITGNRKCFGGQMCRAFEYAAMEGGVDTEEYYPYVKEGRECHFSSAHVGSRVSGYVEIPYGDEKALQYAVALIGPVAVGLDGYRLHFRRYKSGIYIDPGCSNTTLDHAVTVVGYGTENGQDYWLIKNSWGPHWGIGGYGKVGRNLNNMCGMASNAVFPVLAQTITGAPLLNGPRAA